MNIDRRKENAIANGGFFPKESSLPQFAGFAFTGNGFLHQGIAQSLAHGTQCLAQQFGMWDSPVAEHIVPATTAIDECVS